MLGAWGSIGGGREKHGRGLEESMCIVVLCERTVCEKQACVGNI